MNFIFYKTLKLWDSQNWDQGVKLLNKKKTKNLSHVKINVCNKKLYTCKLILSQSKMYVVFCNKFYLSKWWFTEACFFSCVQKWPSIGMKKQTYHFVMCSLEYVSRLRRGELLCIQRVRSRCLRGLHQSSSLTPALPHGPCSAMSSGDSPLRPSPGHGGPWHTAEITSPPYKQPEPIKNPSNTDEPPPSPSVCVVCVWSVCLLLSVCVWVLSVLSVCVCVCVWCVLVCVCVCLCVCRCLLCVCGCVCVCVCVGGVVCLCLCVCVCVVCVCVSCLSVCLCVSCVCVCVCGVCVCVCVLWGHVYVVYEDTNCIMTWV